MNAIPVVAGNAPTSLVQASRPPAEAPMPTTVKSGAPDAPLRRPGEGGSLRIVTALVSRGRVAGIDTLSRR